MTKDEEKIVLYLLENKSINRKQTVEILNYGETKIKELFNHMVDKKLIIRVGQGRSTRYILGKMSNDK
ncbi:MAG: hypothetical protein IE909_16595 [Campylobacterales bacterium]|nr:hypothetical protein [Campylobacterales bacterium]